MASGGGGFHPPVAGFFREKHWKLYAYDFLGLLLKFYSLTLKKKFMALAALGSCHVTSSQQGVNENLQLSRFLEHISVSFQYFFMKFIW